MIDVFLVAARHIVLLAVIHQRSKHTKNSQPNGNPAVTTTYYAGAQEADINNGQATVKTYWPYGLGVEIDQPGSNTSELHWSHHDRLGSIISISDSSGNLKEKLAYDSWGKRRTTDGSATPDTLDGQVDNKGYTGHEMLDQLDLVHMNGRIYDPLMARFLSADPMIQDPAHSQSYNRYTYVWNNPTNLTDPTGFTACNNDDKNCSSTAVVTPVKTCPKGATCINDTNGNAYQFLGYVRGNNSNSKDNSNGGGQENKSAANAANKGGEQSTFKKFLSELDPIELAKQFGRQMMADFVKNNKDTFGWGWFANKADNYFEKPDETSANGVVAKVGATAAMMVSPGGVRAKVVEEVGGMAKVLTKTETEIFNFARAPAAHMENPGRYVPVQIMDDVIKNTPAFPDPKGSSALMYYSPITRNGQPYNLEVLYDKSSNTILHFEYARKEMGPLPALSK